MIKFFINLFKGKSKSIVTSNEVAGSVLHVEFFTKSAGCYEFMFDSGEYYYYGSLKVLDDKGHHYLISWIADTPPECLEAEVFIFKEFIK